jgi:hypothetical protein
MQVLQQPPTSEPDWATLGSYALLYIRSSLQRIYALGLLYQLSRAAGAPNTTWSDRCLEELLAVTGKLRCHSGIHHEGHFYR